MKPIQIIAVVILSSLLSEFSMDAEGRGLVGVDLGSTLRDKVPKISVGHAFSYGWSIEVTSDIGIRSMIPELNEEERGHYEETGREDFTDDDTVKDNRIRIGVKRWKEDAYSGPFVSGGIAISRSGKTDMTTGGGYSFSIYKGLCGSVSYEMEILKTLKDGTSGNEVTIGLHYIF